MHGQAEIAVMGPKGAVEIILEEKLGNKIKLSKKLMSIEKSWLILL